MREAALVAIATAVAAAALIGVWMQVTHVASDPSPARVVAWTLAGGVATALLCVAMSSTFRAVSTAELSVPARLVSLGLANALTLVRFVLIAPTVVLLVDGRYPEALGSYFVLFATDVADGIVARRRASASEFGVVADPLADVLSTFAIFTVFVVRGWCPVWLYVILCVRYAMLFVGSFCLFRLVGPFQFHATTPGKIVGVVQAAGASLIVAGAMVGGLDPTTERALFAFLGIGFASIVLSQAVIGWRLARRRASSSGPTR